MQAYVNDGIIPTQVGPMQYWLYKGLGFKKSTNKLMYYLLYSTRQFSLAHKTLNNAHYELCGHDQKPNTYQVWVSLHQGKYHRIGTCVVSWLPSSPNFQSRGVNEVWSTWWVYMNEWMKEDRELEFGTHGPCEV